MIKLTNYTVSDPTSSTVNNEKKLSLTLFLQVSNSTRSSSGRYIQRQTRSENSVKSVRG
jgi:hypothetical protein